MNSYVLNLDTKKFFDFDPETDFNANCEDVKIITPAAKNSKGNYTIEIKRENGENIISKEMSADDYFEGKCFSFNI